MAMQNGLNVSVLEHNPNPRVDCRERDSQLVTAWESRLKPKDPGKILRPDPALVGACANDRQTSADKRRSWCVRLGREVGTRKAAKIKDLTQIPDK